MPKNLIRLWLVILLGIAFLCGTVYGEDPASGDRTPIPDIEYTYFTLDNGLEIYVFEDHQAPLVDVALWYKVGALDEAEGMTGISHYLEHLMFLGTDGLAKNQIHQLIKKVGGSNNAATSFQYTKYYATVPAASLELVLALEADRLGNLQLDPEEFKREKDVVLQERRMRFDNQPLSGAYETILATAFTGALHHQVIGWEQDIRELGIEQVKEHYQRYYAPNNAILVVAGDTNPRQVRRLAKRYFGSYAPQKIERVRPEEPVQTKERSLTIEKRIEMPYLVMIYKLPAGDHPDLAAVDFLLDILVNKPTSRLTLELEQKQEILLGAGAWVMELPVPGYAQIVLVPAAVEQIDDVKTGFESELNQLIAEGIDPQELLALKKATLKNLVFAQRELADRVEMVMAGKVNYDDPLFYQKRIQRIQALTAEDIVRVAKTYFKPEQRTVGTILPVQYPEKAGL